MLTRIIGYSSIIIIGITVFTTISTSIIYTNVYAFYTATFHALIFVLSNFKGTPQKLFK